MKNNAFSLLKLWYCICLLAAYTGAYAQLTFSDEKLIAQTEVLYPTTIKAADLTGNGFLDLVVLSNEGTELSWFKNNGGNDYGKIQLLTTAYNLIGIGSITNFHFTDIDTDGDQDLLVQVNNTALWLPNNGDGSFGTQQIISTSGQIRAFHVTDFNTDGHQDLLLNLSGNIVWFANNGTGNFGTPQTLISPAPIPYAQIAAADLNGDGHLDLITNNSYFILWYANDGADNFILQPSIGVFGAWNITYHGVADMDNDGDLDIIASYKTTIETDIFSLSELFLVWLPNDGVGNFGAPQVLYSYYNPYWQQEQPVNFSNVQLIDYNNNGEIDALFVLNTIDQENLLSNANDNYCTKSHFYAADYDNNGTIDVASTIENQDRVILKPNGQPQIPLTYPKKADHVIFFDLTKVNASDESPDVLFYRERYYYSYEIQFYGKHFILNNNSGEFSASNIGSDIYCSYWQPGNNFPLCAADFTGNGATDLLMAQSVYGFSNITIKLYQHTESSNYLNGSEVISDAPYYSGAQAVDIDNDGDLDLVCYNDDFGLSYVDWYANNGAGQFAPPEILFNTSAELVFADVNNDNLPDAIVGSGSAFYWLPNLGGGSFGSLQLIGFGVNTFKVADLNGDGNIDIIGRNTTTGETVWLAGNGAGSFAVPVPLPTITNDIAAITDLDLDGDIDLITCSSNQLNWYANNGSGVFGNAQFIAASTPGLPYRPTMVRVGDIDTDGDWDIAVVCGYEMNKIVWYENTKLLPGEPLMPSAAFTTFPAPATANPDTLVICQGQPVQFFNQSQNSNAFLWDFGNGATATLANPTYTYPQPGTYNVQLTAYNNLPYNCPANAGELVFTYSPSTTPLKVDLVGYNSNPGFLTMIVVRNKATNTIMQVFIPPLSEADQLTLGVHYYHGLLNHRTIEAYNFLLPAPGAINPADDPFYIDIPCKDFETFEPCEMINMETDVIFNQDIGLYVVNICVTGGYFGLTDNGGYYFTPQVDNVSYFWGGSTTCATTLIGAYATLTWYGDFGADINLCVYDTGIECCQTITIPDGPPPAQAPQTAGKPAEYADTASLVIVVEPGFAPDISCASTVCEGTVADYSTSATCETYLWEVIGGEILSGQGTPTITVQWNNPSLGSISLSAECGAEYCSLPTVVAIPIIGSIAVIQGQTTFCANDVLQYSAPYFGGTQYQWAINPPGAGVIVSGQNTPLITVQWGNAPATLALTYQNNLLNCGGAASLSVAPKPSFSINPIEPVCEGATSTLSANSLLPFVWSVSGGEILSGQNTNTITVLWNSAGTFSVTIAPVNPDAFCNTTAQASATVAPYPETPQIAGASTVCPLQTYTYTASPALPNTQFIWTIAGGTITAGQNSPTVQVQWTDTPPYLLTVVRQTITGVVCTSEPATISPAPLASSPFVITGSNNACPNSQITYQISPSLIGASYTWSVSPPDAALIVQGQGAGQVSLLFGNTPNTLLTLSASYCNLTAQLPINIGALPQPLIVQADTLCTGSSITLSAADVGSGLPYAAYVWKNAQNTTISTLPTATISAEGIYTLQVTNTSGCSAFTSHRVYQYTSPVATILGANAVSLCVQNPTNYELIALDGTNYAFQWTLDNVPIPGANTPFLTHLGTATEGSFPYRVLITDTSTTCTKLSGLVNILHITCTGGGGGTPSDTLTCPPIAGYSLSSSLSADGANCQTITVNATYSGDFTNFGISWGDGTPQQPFNGVSATHTYSSESVGNFRVRIFGYFIHPVTGAECLRIAEAIHQIPLFARFDLEPACLGSDWVFQDRSYYMPTTTISQWVWDFGDGAPPLTGAQTEAHAYTTPNDYTASLTITNGVCSASATQNLTVAPLPDAEFTVNGGDCAGNTLSFLPNDASLAAYLWQLGNGVSTAQPNPVYSYASPGAYAVSLQTVNEQGCYSEPQTQIITITDAPEAQPITASDTLFCAGLSATLTAPAGGAAYLWSLGQTTPEITVSTSGFYSVQVTLPSGCVYTSPAVNIQVIPAPSAVISPPSPVVVCSGTEATLYAPNNPNYTYAWSQNNNGLSFNSFVSGGAKTVTVTDTTTGCSATGSAQVQIQGNPPAPVISASATQLCEGQNATLSINSPNPLLTYQWTNGATGSSTSVSVSGAYGAIATNSFGCISDTSFLAVITVTSTPNIAAFPAGCYAICPDEPIILPTNTAETYQWYYNGLPIPGATGNSMIPQAEGAYWVVMTNSPNCTLTTEVLQLEFADCAGPLPVSLLSFTGTVEPAGNLLQWTTASETNAAWFTLQASPDGSTFTNLAPRLAAAGNSSSTRQYQHLHQQPYPVTYYRLLQTDYDGITSQAGGVIVLVRQAENLPFAITHLAPNPTQNTLTLTYTTPNAQPLALHLYDLAGKLMYSQANLPASPGIHTATLQLQHLPKGMYLLTLFSAQTALRAKVVKE